MPFTTAAFFIVVSTAYALLTKWALASFAFDASRLLALAQMAISVLLSRFTEDIVFDRQTAVTILPLSVVYASMAILSYSAVHITHPLVFDCVRRTNVVFLLVRLPGWRTLTLLC